jgi:hypothetical protein
LTAAGADLAQVVVPFAIETSGAFALTISEVHLAQRAAGPSPKCLDFVPSITHSLRGRIE